MIECTIHGRAGQGALLSTELMTAALVYEEKWGQGFPMFAGERRGAPMVTNLRIDDKRVRARERIINPDCVMVIDTILAETIPWHAGLKEGGIAVLNTKKSPDEVEVPVKLSKLATIDATGISIRFFGERPLPITNTPTLGALVKTTGWIKLDSLKEAVKYKWPGRLAEVNVKALQASFDEVKVKTF